jgi:hypothetical protein
MQTYYQSANVNDVIGIAQKITVLCKMIAPQFSFRQHAWIPFYQDDAQNPTLFKQEFYSGLIANEEEGVWPASIAAEDNPFGIVAVQGEPVFTTEEKALFAVAHPSLDIDGWTENSGIGV